MPKSFNLVGTRCLVADAHRPSYLTYALAHTKVILVALLLKDICSQSLTISAWEIEDWVCLMLCKKSFSTALYRPMTPYGVMRLMFPYDQWRRTASWVLSCLWGFPAEDSGLLRTVHTCNSIHYIYRKLTVHILIETKTWWGGSLT